MTTVLSSAAPSAAGAVYGRRNGRSTVADAAAASAAVLTVMAWVVALRHMSGMDMGPATALGPLPSFMGVWTPMMAAMMLPGTLPALWRHCREVDRLWAALLFLGEYLALWSLVGLAVYAGYRPHGSSAAGAATIAAGVYELAPAKARLRRCCQNAAGSGLHFGMGCLGSSLGLMVVLLALGVMSPLWMGVVTVLAVAQKVLPARAAVDVPVGVAIVCLGALALAVPSVVPGLTGVM